MRKIAWFLIISSILATVAEFFGWKLPTISWAFNLSHEGGLWGVEMGETEKSIFPWFGYFMAFVGVGVGVLIMNKFGKGIQMLPTTLRRIERFKSNKRGLISFYIILFVVFLASLDQLIVSKQALYMNAGGNIHFPAFERDKIFGKDIGLTGENANVEIDYRKLKREIEEGKLEGTVVMPIIPYDPTQDTVKIPFLVLEEDNDGILLDREGHPMNGSVSVLYNENADKRHLVYEYRKGLRQGLVVGKTLYNDKVYEASYDKGEMVAGSEEYTGQDLINMTKEEFLTSTNGVLTKVFYFASPPLVGNHLLGTNSKGNDLVAYLYGGLQLNIKAILIYIPAIYTIGVAIGLCMGFFGGAFDLIVQRIIEIFSTIPFLFVVIIISDMVNPANRGLGIILCILIAFGWMGMTYLMRTAALKEKARDYVAAARVSGATTSRILFSHILPNTVAILVTLIPFSISGIIMSLTSLDYLGFGLPENYATWGALLKDGLANYSKPWLVASAFTVLVSTLILVTFVGEAVRDAFDPKKFSTYK